MKRSLAFLLAILCVAACTSRDSPSDPDLGPGLAVVEGTVVCPGDMWLTTPEEVAAFNCSRVEGNLWINGPAITHLDPLTALTQVDGSLLIDNNASLTNLDGLSSLTSVGSRLRISWNNSLGNIHGLAALRSFVWLDISYNPSLTNLDGLSSLTSADGNIQIAGNDALNNIDGLSSLTSVGGRLSLGGNPALTHVDGLSALTWVGGDLALGGGALVDIDGLSALTEVGGLVIKATGLSNVDGLSSLASVVGDLFIHHNDYLTDIDGLSSLTSVGGDLHVRDNRPLSACVCGLYRLLASGGVGGTAWIQDNTRGCESEKAILAQSADYPGCVCSDLTSEIQEVVEDGLLNQGQSAALTNMLEQAIAAAEAGRYRPALGQMNAFISRVNALLNAGDLTQEQADRLLDLAGVLINLWSQP